jgi:hypothetical protein
LRESVPKQFSFTSSLSIFCIPSHKHLCFCFSSHHHLCFCEYVFKEATSSLCHLKPSVPSLRVCFYRGHFLSLPSFNHLFHLYEYVFIEATSSLCHLLTICSIFKYFEDYSVFFLKRTPPLYQQSYGAADSFYNSNILSSTAIHRFLDFC